MKSKKSSSQRKHSIGGPARRKKKATSASAPARSSLTSISAGLRFQQVFDEYWKEVQTGQAAVLLRGQQAYATFLKSIEASWDQSEAKELFVAACQKFAENISTLPVAESNGAEASLEEAYQQYIEEVRDVWERPSLMQSIEEASLALTEETQNAADETRRTLESSQKRYVAALSRIWKQVDLEQFDPTIVATVSRNMMATVFFTEGMRGGAPSTLSRDFLEPAPLI